jgi:outer membrane receptor protein involved in Fe transport
VRRRIFLALVASCCDPALAEETGSEKPTELDVLQVTAGRQSESQYQVPQPVTVLTRAELDKLSPQVVAQALAYQPGAFLQQSGPGQGIVIVRGLKGSEVLHLVDGMRLNNAFFRNSPSQYLALVDPQNLAQLELVRGPNATIYGSDAMGGVMQVLTPEERFDSEGWDLRGGVRARYDSADLERSGRVHVASGSHTLSVAGGLSFSEFGQRRLAEPGQSPDGSGGYTLEDRVNDTDYRSRGWDAKALWTPAGGHELMLSAQGFEIPELQRYFQTVPGYGPPPPARAIAEFRNDRRFYHLRYRYALPLGFLENLELHLARQVMNDDRLDRRQDNSRDEFTFNRSTLDGLTAQAETGLGAQRLRYGVELYRDTVDSRAVRETPPGSGNLSDPDGTTFFSPFPDGSRADDFGAWLLDEWHAGERWLLEGGIRYSRHETDVARGDRAFGAELSQDDFTGSAGLRYALTPALAWTANLGRGFRAPNLFDLALVGQRANNRVVIANLDLKPESVTTWDTGLKAVSGGWTSEFVAFYSDYRDRIVTVNPAFAEGAPQCPNDGDSTTMGCAQNQNIARSRYRGFESDARYAFDGTVGLHATMNYTWGDQEQNGVATAANRVPPLNGLFGLEFRALASVSVEPYLFWAGRQDRLDPSDLTDTRINPNGTAGYAIANLRAGWEPAPGARLQLDLRNLLDRPYREHGSGIDGAGFGAALTAQLSL